MPLPPPKLTVYVIDDDQGVLCSLRFLLETEGFEVSTFQNAAYVLNSEIEKQVDCFVIDYKMPSMNGIDLAGRLRDRHITTPIILITGDPDEDIPVKAAAAGLYQVIMKPHFEENLVAHIRQAMHERTASN